MAITWTSHQFVNRTKTQSKFEQKYIFWKKNTLEKYCLQNVSHFVRDSMSRAFRVMPSARPGRIILPALSSLDKDLVSPELQELRSFCTDLTYWGQNNWAPFFRRHFHTRCLEWKSSYLYLNFRADSTLALSQRETSLQSNTVSHWLDEKPRISPEFHWSLSPGI